MTIPDNTLVFDGGQTGFLLLHGLGGTPVEMRPLAKGLARAGFTVLCPQLAGHCGTEADLVQSNFKDWVESSEKALGVLRQRCSTVIVGGLSMGAILSLRLAAKCPEQVDGLALFAPTLWYDGWTIPWYSFLLRLLINTPIGRRFRFVERPPFGIKDERIRSRIQRALMSGDSTEAGLLGTPSAALEQFWKLVDAVKPDLPNIRQPAFLVHAREDDIAALTNTIYIQKHLGGLVQTLVLDDSYHLVTIDRQASIVIERTVGFAEWLERWQRGLKASTSRSAHRAA